MKRRKILWAIFVLAFCFLCLTGCSLLHSSVDLNAYTAVTFDGYDGYGQAEVSVDYAAIDEDYAGKVKVSKDGKLKYYLADETVGSILSYLFTVWVDPEEGLSNGDEVTIHYAVDEQTLSQFLKGRIKFQDETVTVEGLKEVPEKDVFSDVGLEFSGTAPHATAELTFGGSMGPDLKNACTWQVEPAAGLSNGDTVTVSMDLEDVEDFVRQVHVRPKETSKEYTVTGLDTYITDFSELTKEHREQLDQEAQNQIKTELSDKDMAAFRVGQLLGVTDSFTEISVDGEFKLEAIYFLEKKELDEYYLSDYQSAPVFVYGGKVSVVKTQSKEKVASGKIYYAIAFTDLVLEADGDLVGVSEHNVKDYGSLDAAYKDWVTDMKDTWTITLYDGDGKKID